MTGTGAGSSAIGRVARGAWAGAREGWDATSPDARRAFAIRLGVALGVCVAASIGSALALERVAGTGALPGEAPWDERIDGLLGVHAAVWLGAFTSSAMITPMLVAVAVLAAHARRWERAALAVVTYAASKAIITAGWLTWERARPADVADGMLVPVGMASFPSGHTVQVLSVYGLLALWWARSTERRWEKTLAWVLVGALTVAVGVGRVRIGAHYPSDVAGGAALGALWLAGVAWAERALRRARA